MIKIKRLVVLTLVALLIGCSGIRVSQDYDSATRFTELQTYDWQSDVQPETGDVRVDNPLLNTRFRTAIDQNLVGKGFQKKSASDPDFYITYQYTIRQKIQSDNVRTSVGFGFGSYGRYGGVGVGSGADVRSYDEGLLVVDVLEPDSGELLWRGTGTFRVSDHSDPEKTTEKVNEVIGKILDQFPPSGQP